ncbi:hypothetical protein F5Y19DRAFT_476349 [Xylariaceae sp. FL1651]|nr:hypothetical protein F5Y19DRAFT_476349 [Xylariaceae sp. FL1651]
MTSLAGLWKSPTKEADEEHVNGADSDLRGTKRKAKRDPYEDMDDDDDDDDDIIPARKTPTSQRLSRSRVTSETPGSSTRGRPSLGKTKRVGRPSLNARKDDASATATSRTDALANLARAKAPDAARIHPDSLVPEAPMGGLELLGSNAVNTTPSSAAELKATTNSESSVKDKDQAKQPDPKPADQLEDDREEHEIAKLLKHRMASGGRGAVELLVHWAGEEEQDATWEAEEEIQQGAEEMLYAYWKAQGGRINALFHKPKNPPPEIYHVFKVLRHEKKNRGGFQFEVQWVGHPATHGETSMEAEAKLKNIAPEMLSEYWESVGGRVKHLEKRGRAKKPRTE